MPLWITFALGLAIVASVAGIVFAVERKIARAERDSIARKTAEANLAAVAAAQEAQAKARGTYEAEREKVEAGDLNAPFVVSHQVLGDMPLQPRVEPLAK